MRWNSPHFNPKTGRFQNLEMTPVAMMNRPKNLFKMTFEVLFRNSDIRYPKKPIPYLKPDLKSFFSQVDGDELIWLGHSSVLVRSNKKTILLDPVFYQASPVPGIVRRYGPNPFFPKDLPAVDYLVLSHDHYDHLDAKALKELDIHGTKFLVPLGLKNRLVPIGIDPSVIFEFDWWQSVSLDGITFTFAPAQHFSGRNLHDRDQTLWGSWAIRSPTIALFFSGDSGYNSHFKEIHARLGPFDLAMIETGQYNELWTAVHMLPEQSVQAALDLNAKYMLPIHWCAYSLSTHAWNDPAHRATSSAQANGQKIIIPQIGELVGMTTLTKYDTWTPKDPNWWK